MWKRNIECPRASVIEVIKGEGRLAESQYRQLVSPGSQVTFHMQVQAINLRLSVSLLRLEPILFALLCPLPWLPMTEFVCHSLSFPG